MPSHYLNQCWNIVNWTPRNKLQVNFNLYWNIFIQENAYDSGICKMAASSSRPKYVMYNDHASLLCQARSHSLTSLWREIYTYVIGPVWVLPFGQWTYSLTHYQISIHFRQPQITTNNTYSDPVNLVPIRKCEHSNVRHRNAYRFTGLLCVESTGHRWIPLTKER